MVWWFWRFRIQIEPSRLIVATPAFSVREAVSGICLNTSRARRIFFVLGSFISTTTPLILCQKYLLKLKKEEEIRGPQHRECEVFPCPLEEGCSTFICELHG